MESRCRFGLRCALLAFREKAVNVRSSGHDFIPVKRTAQKPKHLGSTQPPGTSREVGVGEAALPRAWSSPVLLSPPWPTWSLGSAWPSLAPGNMGCQFKQLLANHCAHVCMSVRTERSFYFLLLYFWSPWVHHS